MLAVAQQSIYHSFVIDLFKIDIAQA
jgi:hypothetical protein